MLQYWKDAEKCIVVSLFHDVSIFFSFENVFCENPFSVYFWMHCEYNPVSKSVFYVTEYSDLSFE